MSLVYRAVLLLVFGQQLLTLVPGEVCQDLHAYLLLNTTEGTKLTYQSSHSETPQTTVFVGEYIPPECGINFQRCNVTVTKGNQRTVALISLTRGVGLTLYNHTSSGLQYLNHHVLALPESLHCRMTTMSPLRPEGYILGLCLDLTRPENDNIEHLLVYVNFSNVTSSVFYQDNRRYSAEHLFEPSLFSEFVFAPDARCIVDDSYHIYSVDDGYVLDFRKESSSDGFTYDAYCINHHGCSHAERLMLVSRNTLAVHCSNVTTILYDVCSTPTVTTPQSCQVGQLSLNELKVFHATVSGTPHFCSEEVYVLQKDSTLTVVYKDTTNWTIPLLTSPTDQIIYASCSQVGNETVFLSYWDSGQTYLTHVTENVTNLIGRNTRVSNVRPKIFQQRYAVVNNRSESLVFNLSCTAPQIQVNHPHHLATVVVAETTHECECTQQMAPTEPQADIFNSTDGTTETPAGISKSTDGITETPAGISNGTDGTTETPAGIFNSTDGTPETPAGIFNSTDGTPDTPTENSSSTDTTVNMTVSISTVGVVQPGETLVVGATVSTVVVVFAILLSLVVMGVIACSVWYCRRPKRLHQRIPSQVSIHEDIEMQERPRSFQSSHSAPPSPCRTSARHSEPNRRISYTFGQDLPDIPLSLFAHLPGAADVPELAEPDHVEEEQNSNTPSYQQQSESSLYFASAHQDSDLHSEWSTDTEFPVNSDCVPASASPQQTPEPSLHIVSASQSSDLQSTSEDGQLQSIGTNFDVNMDCVLESTPTQPGRPRQDGVATGSELPFAPETIHLEDIRRKHRENRNERDFKVNELHGELS